MTDMDPAERAVNVALTLVLVVLFPGLIIASFWRIPWQYGFASAVVYVALISGLATVATREKWWEE